MRKQPPVLQTTTDEPYLSTRLVYTVHQPDALRRWFERHPTMAWDADLRRWTWNYHRKLRKLGFSAIYGEVARRQGGLVLASCYLVERRTLHVYTRSGLRALQQLQKASGAPADPPRALVLRFRAAPEPRTTDPLVGNLSDTPLSGCQPLRRVFTSP